MKIRVSLLLFFLISVSYLSQAQNLITPFVIEIKEHIEGEGDDCFIDGNKLYVPERAENNKLELVIYSLLSHKKIGKYVPSEDFVDAPGFSIENGFIYYHTSGYISKVSLETNKLIWETEYDSGMAAQINPFFTNDYVGIDLDDKFYLVNKMTGKEFISIDGDDFDQGAAMSGDFFIYAHSSGTVHAYNPTTKKDAWKFNVGESAGVGALTDGDRMFLPSSNVRIYCVDRKTGKQIWKIQKDELQASCGSGFGTPPLMVGNKLYALQRETGLYIIDKESGEINDVIEFEDNVSSELFLYNGVILFCTESELKAFEPESKTIETLAKYEVAGAYPNVILQGDHLCLYYIGFYDVNPVVHIFDLSKLK